MNKGNAGKGRPKGAKNHSKVLRVAEVLSRAGINPAEEIMKLLPLLEVRDQVRTWQELQSYCEAKPREVEVTPDLPEDLKEVETAKLLSLVNSQK